jgi:hypothetical protein
MAIDHRRKDGLGGTPRGGDGLTGPDGRSFPRKAPDRGTSVTTARRGGPPDIGLVLGTGRRTPEADDSKGVFLSGAHDPLVLVGLMIVTEEMQDSVDKQVSGLAG